MGGISASLPVAMTIASDRNAPSEVSTTPGPAIRPRDFTTVTPRSRYRFTRALSSWLEPCSPGSGKAGPVELGTSMPAVRPHAAASSAGRSSVFEGIQPQFVHSPPISSCSTSATRAPALASVFSATSPPGRPPR